MIYNAKVIDAEIGTYDDVHNPGDIAISLKLEYINGVIDYCVNADKINDVFEILGITNFKDIKQAYCRIEEEKKCFTNIGHIIKDKWLWRN